VEIGGFFGGVVNVGDGVKVAVAFLGLEGAGQWFGRETSGDDEDGLLSSGDEATNPPLFFGVVGGGCVGEVLREAGFGFAAFPNIANGAVVGVDEVIDVEHLEWEFDGALVGVSDCGVL
jgi:hypothetical protein